MGTSDAATASGEGPEGVTDLSKSSWFDAFKRTGKAFKADKLGVWAAALTYFGVLLDLPRLAGGGVGPRPDRRIRDRLTAQEPRGRGSRPGAGDLHQRDQEPPGRGQRVRHRLRHRHRWRDMGILGLRRRLRGHAANAIYDVEEGRPITKTLPVRVGLTMVLMVLAAVIAFAVTLTGGLAKQAGDVLGVGDTAVDVWGGPWPVLLLLVSLLLAVLYWRAQREVALPFHLAGKPARRLGSGDRVGGVRVLRRELQLLQHRPTEPAPAGPIVFPLVAWTRTSASCSGRSSTPSSSAAGSLEAGEVAHEEEQFVELRNTEKLDGSE